MMEEDGFSRSPSPYCSRSRWPSEQSTVSHSSTYTTQRNPAMLHLLSGTCADGCQRDSCSCFFHFFHLGIIVLSDIAFYFSFFMRIQLRREMPIKVFAYRIPAL